MAQPLSANTSTHQPSKIENGRNGASVTFIVIVLLLRGLDASVLTPALFAARRTNSALLTVAESRKERPVNAESFVLPLHRVRAPLTECEVVLAIASLVAVSFYAVGRLASLQALSIGRQNGFLIEANSPFVVIKVDSLNFAISLLARGVALRGARVLLIRCRTVQAGGAVSDG